MPIRSRGMAKKRAPEAYVDRLPKAKRKARTPNLGLGHIRDPETRRVVPVPKKAPPKRKHAKA